MRIIERERIPNPLFRVTCGFCETIFEFTKSEGEVVYDQRDGSSVKIACPVCKTPIFQDLK